MPTYQIEQYELHSAKYHVKATCEAEAIAKFLEGEGNPVNESLEFIEMAEDRGMPVDDHPSLVRSLRKHDIAFSNFIPSIRSIEVVKRQSPRTSLKPCTTLPCKGAIA